MVTGAGGYIGTQLVRDLVKAGHEVTAVDRFFFGKETLSEFIDFVNNFKSGNYKFQNGSNINITDSDILHIKNLFESLNVKNRERMISELFTDGTTFKQHLTFSQKVRNLL